MWKKSNLQIIICRHHKLCLKFHIAGMMPHAYNLSTHEPKAGEWWAQGQLGLSSKILSKL